MKWRYLGNFFFLFVIIICIGLVAVLSFYLYFTNYYDDKVYPGVTLGDLNLAGKTYGEARDLIADRAVSIMKDGLKFSYGGQEKTIDPGISGLSIEALGPIVNIDAPATVDAAYNYGRSENFADNLLNQIFSLMFKKDAAAVYNLDEDQLRAALKQNFSSLETPVADAGLDIQLSAAAADGFDYSVKKEQPGQAINYDDAIAAVKKNLADLDNPIVSLDDAVIAPKVLASQVGDVRTEINDFLNLAPVTLQYQDNYGTSTSWKFKFNKDDVASWLGLENSALSGRQSKIQVVLDSEKIAKILDERIGTQINRDPIQARFEIKNGKVVTFQAGGDGLKIDDDATIQKIKDHFAAKSAEPIDLAVEDIPDTSTDQVDNLGIKEIIGTGHSNFAGSPANRRHNISVGAAAINGLLIKPGEEFSLVKALGNVDASTGYLPELVIKENKTIPEYGGGLCQIGTTLFRAALKSGLPITERHNHSYRVAYYEPAGMDAAVYIPHPDVRFINDSGNYILIQVRISGNDIYFDFWGVKDGRKVEISKPVLYNIVKPQPPKIAETLDLKPGEKKCTEHAHDGADAYFDYKVTYYSATSTDNSATTTGAVVQKRFSSHYAPWQEVCLIGVKQLSAGASSTPAILINPDNAIATSSN